VSSWEQLKDRFEELADLPPSRRAAYLEEVCGDDESLRAELLRLLTAEEQAGDFMAAPAITSGSGASTATGAVAVFSPGEMLAGRFRIVCFRGEGGMGQVYQAEDEVLGGYVALKVIRPEIASDERTFERFKQEVRLAKAVTHENVCRVFDLNHDHVPPFVTMELVEGETLSRRLRRKGKLEPEDAFLLVKQMAAGLDAAHQKGIIHRDFKPGNVMLSRTAHGTVCAKITDFGLARSAQSEVSAVPGKVLGTPGYMAPEQLAGGRASAASDIYALGLVMYQMVTGARPEFDRLNEPAPSPCLLNPELDANWESAILRCLERDPARRFSRATEVTEALQSGAGESETVTQEEDGTGRSKFSRRKLIVAAIVTLLAGGVLAISQMASQPLNTSVIVFPITNLTNTNAYDYLCKGTTTELMRRLTQLGSIRVVPSPVSPVRGPVRLADVGFALNGELQEFHNQIHLTVQLTNRKDGTLVWSQKFERELQDPLELQAEIAKGTVDGLERQVFGVATGDRTYYLTYGSLALRLRRLFAMQLPRPPTASNAAMEAYMRGLHLWDERTLPATLSAIDYFHRAVKEDGRFALADAALADTQFTLMEFNYAPQAELLRRAREYAEQAVALGPDAAETYVSLAVVRQALWDWSSAEECFRHAIQLNPRLARAHWWYAGLMLQFGRFDEAIKETQEALRLDPYNYPLQSFYGMNLYYARRYQDALQQLQHTLAEKDFMYAHINIGYVYATLGSASSGPTAARYFEKAFQEAAMVAEMERGPSAQTPDGAVLPFADCMYAIFNAMTGNRAAALKILERLEQDRPRMSPVQLSEVYTALGDKDRAIELLQQAENDQDRILFYLKVQPMFDPLRSSPRFQDLLTRMKL
jgi:eukaryotic-like serine/threonine-protein kinase